VADPFIDGAIERATANLLRETDPEIDPLFPTAVVRGCRLLGRALDVAPLLESWRFGSTRDSGAIRYRWAMIPRLAGPPPAWVPPEGEWAAWRPLDAMALAEMPDRREAFEARLLTPIILADMIQLLADAAQRDDEAGVLARSYLDEARPKLRRDAVEWVQERHAWGDTWALRALARRPAALCLLQPFALAIADAYAATARLAAAGLPGTGYPFDGVPLVSASAQLASGLLALGLHPRLVGSLASWIRERRNPDGGWGDGGGPSDVLTTLVAGELIASLDPTDDASETATWLARAQDPDGWWRAFGPETTWLSVEVLDWLRQATRPFADRFLWPSLAVASRDHRTDLPFCDYVADLEQLFAVIPGLATAPVEIAFIDLAGFGAFNNEHGMAMGDEALRAFADAIDALDGALAVRDGGDEFLVVGTPTATGLPKRLAAFSAAWPARFSSRFPGATVIAPRILTGTTTGSGLIHGRDVMGGRIGDLGRDGGAINGSGAQLDLGTIAPAA
jgi:hypothetical protein